MSSSNPQAPTLSQHSGDDPEQATLLGDANTLPPTSATGESADPSRAILARGDALGRYLIVDVLGRGGMGVVYAAYDPELDRKLAIKLLRPGFGASGSTRGRGRLVREAQAMARLSHRNVVAVHDVGELAESVFVAMEFIDGRTLTEWLADTEAKRGWQDVLGTFLEAGRGLEAAHAAGLVHRDFKPDNVMVGDDGRVVVLDFGLAHGTGATSEPGASEVGASSDASSSALHVRLTVTGAMMGTPAYMSPEQFAGRPTDARTDQFSFCVALYSGLYGQPPFAGESVAELTHSVMRDEVAAPPRGSGVPGWVRRALLRGMSRKVADRYPNMTLLLAALGRDPARRWRRGAAAGGGLALVLAGVYGGKQLSATDDACAFVATAFDDAWGAPRRAAIHDRFASVESSLATDTWQRVEGTLDAYAESWADTRVLVCHEAQTKDSEASAIAVEKARCLDALRLQAQEITRVLSEADRSVVSRAVDMVGSLPEPATCLEPRAYLNLLPMPVDPKAAQAVAHVRRELARIDALARSGRIQEVLATSESVVAKARATGYAPAVTEALQRHANGLVQAGRAKEAMPVLEEVVRQAIAQSREFVAASALVEAAVANTAYLGQQQLAQWQINLATALADKVESPDLKARVDAIAATVWLHADEPDALEVARERAERAAAFYAAQNNDLRHAAALVTLSNIHFARDDEAAAGKVLHEARGLIGTVYGERHIQTATIDAQLARVMSSQGDHRGAVEALRRAHDVFYETVGENHVNTMATANGLGMELQREGEWDDALTYASKAYEIGRKVFGTSHGQLDTVRNNYASALRHLGRADEAVALMEASVADATAREGPSSEVARRSRELYADTLRAAGRLEDAQAQYEGVLAEHRAGGPEADDWLPRPLAGLALTKLAQGDEAAALPLAREAVEVSKAVGDGKAGRIPLLTLAYVLRKTGDTDGASALQPALAEAFAAETKDPLGASYRRWLAGEDVVPNM